MTTARTRLGALALVSILAVTACSGGFGGVVSAPSAAAERRGSTAPSAAPSAVPGALLLSPSP